MERIEILGGLTVVEEGVKKKLGSGGRLLAYLVLQSPQVVDRQGCASDLYPSDRYEVSGNRLRVALVRLRQKFKESLIVDHRGIQFIPGDVAVDYWDACHQFRSVIDQVDLAEEYEKLKELLPVLEQRLMPEVDDDWAHAFQKKWREDCMGHLRRLGEIADDLRDWTVLLQAGTAGLRQDRNSVLFWRYGFKASFALSHDASFLSDWRQFVKSELCLLSPEEISDVEDAFTKQRDALTRAGREWSDSQLLTVGRMVMGMIENHRDELARFFVSDGISEDFYRDPSPHLPFLKAILKAGSLTEENELDIRLRIVEGVSFSYEWATVFEQTSEMLERDLNEYQRAAILFYRAFASFHIRDYDSAIREITESMELSDRGGFPTRVANAGLMLSAFYWQRGDFEQGLALKSRYRSELELSENVGRWLNIGVSWSNEAAVWFILGDFEKALFATQRCFECQERTQSETVLAMQNTITGAVLVVNGQVARGVELLIDGLKRSYRRKSNREMQIGLEWAAGALQFGGQNSTAFALLKWVDQWRDQSHHIRSVAERVYSDRIEKLCGDVTLKPIDPEEDVRNVIAFAIRQLRELRVETNG